MKTIDKNDDLLELFASLNNHEVFTPPSIARDILDLLPEKVWSEPQYKFLDPAVKTGVFLREIMFRLFKGLEGKGVITGYDGKKYNLNNSQERMNHIFKNMLFGISTSELTGYMGRRTLYGVMNAASDKSEDIIDSLIKYQDVGIKGEDKVDNSLYNVSYNEYYDRMIFEDYYEYWSEGNIFYPHTEVDALKEELEAEGKDTFGVEDTFFPFIQEEDTEHKKIKEIKENRMKFDVIIGNPPYQIADGGGKESTASSKPLYNLFIEMAISLNPEYLTMIIPSRWFATGKGLDKFRKDMLSDSRLKLIVDFPDSQDCFPSVKIGGGVNYFLWSKNSKDSFHIQSIFMKDGKRIVSPKKEIDKTKYNILVRNPEAISILEKVSILKGKVMSETVFKRKPFGISTNFKNYTEKSFKNSIKIYGNKFIGYIEEKEILKNNELINEWKTLSPKTGMGLEQKPYKIIHPPKISEPGSICTETYIIIGSYNSEKESKNMISYYKTKFFRFLVSIAKTGQDSASKVYQFVPVLPMTEEWTDEKLYKKYNLTKEEIDYIEKSIKEMK